MPPTLPRRLWLSHFLASDLPTILPRTAAGPLPLHVFLGCGVPECNTSLYLRWTSVGGFGIGLRRRDRLAATGNQRDQRRQARLLSQVGGPFRPKVSSRLDFGGVEQPPSLCRAQKQSRHSPNIPARLSFPGPGRPVIWSRDLGRGLTTQTEPHQQLGIIKAAWPWCPLSPLSDRSRRITDYVLDPRLATEASRPTFRPRLKQFPPVSRIKY
jgi:hypothetical protein